MGKIKSFKVVFENDEEFSREPKFKSGYLILRGVKQTMEGYHPMLKPNGIEAFIFFDAPEDIADKISSAVLDILNQNSLDT